MLHAVQSRPHRHSLFELDPTLLSPLSSSSGHTTGLSSTASTDSLHSSSPSSSSSKRRRGHLGRPVSGGGGKGGAHSGGGQLSSPANRLPYNARIFRGMRNSGQRPLADDVEATRRESREALAESTSMNEQRTAIADALSALDELSAFLGSEDGDDNGEKDIFFLYEYTAFLSWAYTTIRFCGFIGDLHSHFQDMKESFRRLLLALPEGQEHRFLAVLRFSQLCLEYAELCDGEALSWCRIALEQITDAVREKNARLDSVPLGEGEAVELAREAERLQDMAQRILNNVNHIEYTWTIRLPIGKLSEKLV